MKSFGLKPAEFTPKNLSEEEKFLQLFLLPLFALLFFLMTTFISFLVIILLSASFVVDLEVLGSLKHSEKPVEV